MSTKRTKRKQVRAGAAILMIGAILGVVGLTASPAGAEKPNTFKITLCHRTNAPTNPYRIIEVAVDATNGEIVGPDHTGHPGPVFDFTADPSDPGYPYTTPRNGDQWGDIIPAYEFDGGSFPGMNWTEAGQAVFEADCQGPEEEPDPTCPEGQVWDDANENAVIDEGECVTPIDCPEGTEWDDANENGITEDGECDEVTTTTESTTTTSTTVLGSVVTQATPATVGGVQVTRQLPRTGTGTTILLLSAAGLMATGLALVATARLREQRI